MERRDAERAIRRDAELLKADVVLRQAAVEPDVVKRAGLEARAARYLEAADRLGVASDAQA